MIFYIGNPFIYDHEDHANATVFHFRFLQSY